MNQQLRNLSPRPSTIVDNRSKLFPDPSTGTVVGTDGPLGRERIVYALPLGGGPVAIVQPVALADGGGGQIADPDGNLIGEVSRVIVHRMLSARWTEDTRRLAG